MRNKPLTLTQSFWAGLALIAAFLLIPVSDGALAQDAGPLTLEALRNATYDGIFEEPVQLSDGEFAGEPVVEGGAARPTVQLTDHAFGDLDGDGQDDAAVILVANTGGSGSFVHLAAVTSQNDEPVNVATVLLGDRVAIESINISEGQIAIAALTHAAEDPLCCPSAETTLFYTLENGMLVKQTGLEDTTWVLTAYGDPEAPQAVLPGREITALFDVDAGRVGGSAGCNSYFAGLELDGSALMLSGVGSTMMACEAEVMEQEQAFLAILGAAESYAIIDGQLWITAEGQVLMFDAQTTLENITWVLTAYGDPEAPQAVLPGKETTALFDVDEGQVGGSAGCNRYSAGFELDGSALTLSPVVSTKMACEAAVMEQEQAFLAILEAAQSYSLSGGHLWLFAEEQILVFTPQSAADPASDPLIIITAPQPQAELDGAQSLHIAGIGRGLFEGNVVVQVLDAENNILIEQPTTLQGENVGIGEPGSWAIDVTVDTEPGTSARIVAFSTSPADGSVLASDSRTMTFSAE